MCWHKWKVWNRSAKVGKSWLVGIIMAASFPVWMLANDIKPNDPVTGSDIAITIISFVGFGWSLIMFLDAFLFGFPDPTSHYPEGRDNVYLTAKDRTCLKCGKTELSATRRVDAARARAISDDESEDDAREIYQLALDNRKK